MSETETSERPTFDEVFQLSAESAEEMPSVEDPPSSDPAPDPEPAETTTADAIDPPAEPETPAVPPVTGPIPFERHEAVLGKSRQETEAARQELKALQDELGWARTVDRDAVAQAVKLGQLYQGDRQGYWRQQFADAKGDPTLTHYVRTELAKEFGLKEAEPDTSMEPDIPVVDAEGRVVNQTYSAKMIDERVERRVEARLTEMLGPMKTDYDARQQAQKDAAATQQLNDEVSKTYQHAVDTLPQFKEREAEIEKVFATLPLTPGDTGNWNALLTAWSTVVGKTLSNTTTTQAQTLDALKTKAQAGSVNPASAAVATKTRPTSFSDPALSWE